MRHPRPQKPGPTNKKKDDDANDRSLATLRIVGGTFRGRRLIYNGDMRTRPMKDRTREAIFNLVGTDAQDKYVIDLFAGTGALGLEALSRGASGALFIEQHFPTADTIKQNIELLGVGDRSAVAPANTFIWAQRNLPLPETPWLIFCSPPYVFYTERADDMTQLISSLIVRAPGGSVMVVEADQPFLAGLPPQVWDMREYHPAVVQIFRKPVRPTV